jgi:hypothetical protein
MGRSGGLLSGAIADEGTDEPDGTGVGFSFQSAIK